MFDDVRTSQVESELVTTSGHLAAATCRFLQLLAEFDTRDGWAGPGLRSCAHWLNWRVGMSLRTARDHLRVAHALAELPATTAAFAAGQVSYSKARAITRIATPSTEEGLLNIALHGTTSQLESLVAAARAAGDPRPPAARRAMRTSRAADGSLLVSLRIPAERGEQLVAKIEAYLAEHPAAPSPTAAPSDAENGSPEPPDPHPTGPDNCDDQPPDDTDTDTDTDTDEDDRAEAHRQSLANDAELLARAREHAPGVTTEPVAARRLDALLALLDGVAADRPTKLVVHVRLDDDPLRPRAWIDGGPAIPLTTAQRLTCNAAVQALLLDRRDNPLYLGRTRRLATAAQIMALRVRDGDTCAFPGCTTTHHLEAHHLQWWRWGGTTDIDNLALICGFHHTLIHDHGYRAAHTPDGVVFRRPDGSTIPNAGPPLTGTADDLLAEQATLDIDDWTITPNWGGEALDRDIALAWLLPELHAAAAA